MHQLVRLYAAGQAAHSLTKVNRDAAFCRLFDYYLHSARAADRRLDPHRVPIQLTMPQRGCRPHSPPDHASALYWFADEHANLVAVQQLAVRHGWHHSVWQLAWVTHSFHWQHGHIHDQVDSWRAAATAAEHLDDPAARALAYRLLGSATARLGQFEQAAGHLRLALDLAVKQDDLLGQAHTHRALARVCEQRLDHQQALDYAAEALRLYRAVDAPRHTADALDLICWYHIELGRFDQARAHGLAALALYRACSDPDGEATALDSLGYLAHQTDRHQEALAHYRAALVLLHGRNPYHEANILERIGETHAVLDDTASARTAWQQALELYQRQQRVLDVDRILARLRTDRKSS